MSMIMEITTGFWWQIQAYLLYYILSRKHETFQNDYQGNVGEIGYGKSGDLTHLNGPWKLEITSTNEGK